MRANGILFWGNEILFWENEKVLRGNEISLCIAMSPPGLRSV